MFQFSTTFGKIKDPSKPGIFFVRTLTQPDVVYFYQLSSAAKIIPSLLGSFILPNVVENWNTTYMFGRRWWVSTAEIAKNFYNPTINGCKKLQFDDQQHSTS